MIISSKEDNKLVALIYLSEITTDYNTTEYEDLCLLIRSNHNYGKIYITSNMPTFINMISKETGIKIESGGINVNVQIIKNDICFIIMFEQEVDQKYIEKLDKYIEFSKLKDILKQNAAQLTQNKKINEAEENISCVILQFKNIYQISEYVKYSQIHKHDYKAQLYLYDNKYLLILHKDMTQNEAEKLKITAERYYTQKQIKNSNMFYLYLQEHADKINEDNENILVKLNSL